MSIHERATDRGMIVPSGARMQQVASSPGYRYAAKRTAPPFRNAAAQPNSDTYAGSYAPRFARLSRR